MSEKNFSAEQMRTRGYERATIAERERIERAKEEAAALILKIEQAFKDVPRPRITLRVARGYDDEWDLSEKRIDELSARDPEYDWTEVEDEAIKCFQEYFTFSDAGGWRFYLPAFMHHYLRNFPDCRYDAVYWACTGRAHVQLLNAEQLTCLDQFVELCHKYEHDGEGRLPGID